TSHWIKDPDRFKAVETKSSDAAAHPRHGQDGPRDHVRALTTLYRKMRSRRRSPLVRWWSGFHTARVLPPSVYEPRCSTSNPKAMRHERSSADHVPSPKGREGVRPRLSRGAPAVCGPEAERRDGRCDQARGRTVLRAAAVPSDL